MNNEDLEYIKENYKERFCILTVDAKDSDDTALRKLRSEFMGVLEEYNLKASAKSKVIADCKQGLINENMLKREPDVQPW